MPGKTATIIVGIVILIIVAFIGLYFMTPKSHPAPGTQYTFYKLVDSNGNDIKQMPALADNVEGLKAWCNADDTCRGFNTNGWMKNVIVDPSKFNQWAADTPENANKGLYVKL